MAARVVSFVSAQTLRRRRPLPHDRMKLSMNALVNDLQILALDEPVAIEWFADVAHDLARRALARYRRKMETASRGQG